MRSPLSAGATPLQSSDSHFNSLFRTKCFSISIQTIHYQSSDLTDMSLEMSPTAIPSAKRYSYMNVRKITKKCEYQIGSCLNESTHEGMRTNSTFLMSTFIKRVLLRTTYPITEHTSFPSCSASFLVSTALSLRSRAFSFSSSK